MGVMIAGVGLLVVRAIASRDGKVNSTALLLGGVAISFFSLALVLLTSPFVNREAGRSFSFWANGSFALATWSGVVAVAPLVVVGLVITFGIASRVDPLSLGSVAARALGVDADRVTQYALVAVVLLVAPGVTVVGIIAFVGLVVPHALRFFLGPRNTFPLPASAVFGGLLWRVRISFPATCLPCRNIVVQSQRWLEHLCSWCWRQMVRRGGYEHLMALLEPKGVSLLTSGVERVAPACIG